MNRFSLSSHGKPPRMRAFFAVAVIALFGVSFVSVSMVQAQSSGEIASGSEMVVVVGDPTPRITDPQTGPLNHPFAVAFDDQNRMVIAEYTGSRVLRRTADGKVTVIAGHGERGYSGDGQPASKAAFHDIHNLAIAPSGDIFLSDHENNVVRMIEAKSGRVDTFAGNGKPGFDGDGGIASDALFHQVMCVTLTPNGDHLLVSDLKNRRIRSIELSTKVVRTIAGNGKKGVPRDGSLATEAPLVDPRAAATDSKGNLYIVERGGNALRLVWPSGRIETVAGTGKKGKQDGPALQAEMNGPKHLAIDAVGNVYIADDMNHLIRKYDPVAKTLTTVLGDGEFRLNRPHGVTVHEGWLYIADSWNHRIVKLRLE